MTRWLAADQPSNCNTWCSWLEGRLHSHTWAVTVASVTDAVVKILVTIILALIVRRLIHKAIGRLAERVAEGKGGFGLRHLPTRVAPDPSPWAGERRAQRARTMGSVLQSLTTGAVVVFAALAVLGALGLNHYLGPLFAGAGVVGLALAFGAQSLIRDVISGLLMIIEDQYGVGDVVDLKEATGTVEAVGLRVTRIRDVDGTVWYMRNGLIQRVGNQSQGWARAVLDVAVPYTEDVQQVQDALAALGEEFHQDPEWQDTLVEPPEVWGVQELSSSAVVVRMVLATRPLTQWKVAREMRHRIKSRFDELGIQLQGNQPMASAVDNATNGVEPPVRPAAPPPDPEPPMRMP